MRLLRYNSAMRADLSSNDNVLAALRSQIKSSSSILIAVSGGPDSVALLLGLAELRAEFGLRLCAAHVNHGWRGAEADADAAWVAELGRQCDVPTEILTVTPTQTLELAGRSREEGARDVRYQLLIESARRHGCGQVAVGHTADDQVETVLHHILRGTGLAGLGGMPAQRVLAEGIELVRPMLTIPRADVLAYLSARGQSFRHDVTNEDVSLTRNRLRHDLLPLLRDQFNPQVESALLRLADHARETVDVLEVLARRLLAEVVLSESESECRLDAARLSNESLPLIRETLRQLWVRRDWPRQEMGRREWDRLAALVTHPGAIDLPGHIHARRATGPLVIRHG